MEADRKSKEEERENLLHILRDNNVCRINHIGSTSVCGLMSKPTVDILLEISEPYDMDTIADMLINGGWISMSRNYTEKTLDLNKGYSPDGYAKRVFHLHVKPSGDWDELYFRDYLQQNSDIARHYEELKLSLMEQFEYDRNAYTDAKTAFIVKYTKKGVYPKFCVFSKEGERSKNCVVGGKAETGLPPWI